MGNKIVLIVYYLYKSCQQEEGVTNAVSLHMAARQQPTAITHLSELAISECLLAVHTHACVFYLHITLLGPNFPIM